MLYQGVLLDITQRKRNDEQLRKLSLAVEQSPVSVMITDREGAIEYVNPRFTELTGYTFEEARGQNPRILKSGYTSDGVYREMWERMNLVPQPGVLRRPGTIAGKRAIDSHRLPARGRAPHDPRRGFPTAARCGVRRGETEFLPQKAGRSRSPS